VLFRGFVARRSGQGVTTIPGMMLVMTLPSGPGRGTHFYTKLDSKSNLFDMGIKSAKLNRMGRNSI
jgi:hypothetical protein